MSTTSDDLIAWWSEIDPVDDLEVPEDVWENALDGAFDDDRTIDPDLYGSQPGADTPDTDDAPYPVNPEDTVDSDDTADSDHTVDSPDFDYPHADSDADDDWSTNTDDLDLQ